MDTKVRDSIVTAIRILNEALEESPVEANPIEALRMMVADMECSVQRFDHVCECVWQGYLNPLAAPGRGDSHLVTPEALPIELHLVECHQEEEPPSSYWMAKYGNDTAISITDSVRALRALLASWEE